MVWLPIVLILGVSESMYDRYLNIVEDMNNRHKKYLILIFALIIIMGQISSCKKFSAENNELTASLTINQINYTGTTYFSGLNYDYGSVSRVYKDEASDSLHMFFQIEAFHYDTLGTRIRRNAVFIDHYLRIHQNDWEQCGDKNISIQRDPLKIEYFFDVKMRADIDEWDEQNPSLIYVIRYINCSVTNAVLTPVGKTKSDVGKQQFRIKIWANDRQDDSPYEVEGECRVRFIPTKDNNYEWYRRYHKDAE